MPRSIANHRDLSYSSGKRQRDPVSHSNRQDEAAKRHRRVFPWCQPSTLLNRVDSASSLLSGLSSHEDSNAYTLTANTQTCPMADFDDFNEDCIPATLVLLEDHDQSVAHGGQSFYDSLDDDIPAEIVPLEDDDQPIAVADQTPVYSKDDIRALLHSIPFNRYQGRQKKTRRPYERQTKRSAYE